jgi:hypothetical protein
MDPNAEFNRDTILSAGVLPFYHDLFLQNVLCLFKFINNTEYSTLLPPELALHASISGHSTRGSQSNKLNAFAHSRKCEEHSFISGAIRDWNTLPNDITKQQSIKVFKKMCSMFLLTKYN